eukprot:10070840-Alexandrium_andersonii.AAC.1
MVQQNTRLQKPCVGRSRLLRLASCRLATTKDCPSPQAGASALLARASRVASSSCSRRPTPIGRGRSARCASHRLGIAWSCVTDVAPLGEVLQTTQTSA